MSVFDPLDLEVYNKRFMPSDPQSQREFLDSQLRQLERATKHLVDAVKQLQDEQALIWTALNALGQTRP